MRRNERDFGGPSIPSGGIRRAVFFRLVVLLIALAPAPVAAGAPARQVGRQEPPFAWFLQSGNLDRETWDVLETKLIGRDSTFVSNQLGEPDRVSFAKGSTQLSYRWGRGLIHIYFRGGRVYSLGVEQWPADDKRLAR